MFEVMNENEMLETDGGIPLVLGILAGVGIVGGTALVVAGSVVLVGKAAQKLSDWIG